MKKASYQLVVDSFQKLKARAGFFTPNSQPLTNYSSSGFTLIELLVVIAIIALLSSTILASLNDARTKSRDARRLTDLRQIAQGMELYANEHSSVYPGDYGEFYFVSDNNYAESLPCSSTTGLKPYFQTDICNYNDPQGYSYVYAKKSDGTYKVGAHFETTQYQTIAFVYGASDIAVTGWYEKQ